MRVLVFSGWCHDSGTSAVWTLIPAIGAVRNPVAQFAHMNAEISSSTLVLVGRAPWYSAVWACETEKKKTRVISVKLCSLTNKKHPKPFHVIILCVNSLPYFPSSQIQLLPSSWSQCQIFLRPFLKNPPWKSSLCLIRNLIVYHPQMFGFGVSMLKKRFKLHIILLKQVCDGTGSNQTTTLAPKSLLSCIIHCQLMYFGCDPI